MLNDNLNDLVPDNTEESAVQEPEQSAPVEASGGDASAETAPAVDMAAEIDPVAEPIAEGSAESAELEHEVAEAVSEPAEAEQESPAVEESPAPADATAEPAADSPADAESAASTAEGDDAKGGGRGGKGKHKHAPDDPEKLIAEAETAPHKVYLLGRVRKAITAAGESEIAQRLKSVEEAILAQVEERKSAKEVLCERAEALQETTAWKVTGDAYKALFEEWKLIGAAGRELDDQLWARFNAARGAFNERRSKHFEERELAWAGNREKKEALCEQAEALADSTDWKKTAEAIRDLQTQWKAAGSAGRERDEALWARFNTAKQQFFDRRTEVWDENRKRKEALVSDAEALQESTDWRGAGEAIKAMQAEWKNIGPAGREHEDALWTRFRTATQAFFDRRGNVFAERSKTERENLTKKQDLVQRAEALAYTGDALSASREAKDLQAQWKETGPIPREQSEALWNRFRAACDKIFESASGERDRQQNEWHLRMKEALARKREQLNALRESIAHDEANIERWRESLSTLKPGGKSDEIGTSLENKIIDVVDRIRGKQERLEDLRTSINDIEAKLKD